MNKDHLYLAKLRDYYANTGVFPPYSGIAKLIGMRSKGGVSAMVKRLANAGYLDVTSDRRIKPQKSFFERELVDCVQAGLPQSANDTLAEPFSIDEYLINTPSRTVLLTIKGDSMIEAGLMPGDVVIVKKGAPANVGNIIVAIVDGKYTVKYLEARDGQYYLRPANKAYPEIHARDHLEIFGLVVGSFRKY